MAVPLIPFAAGAAVGSAITYVLKEENARKAVEEGLGVVLGFAKATADWTMGLFHGAPAKPQEPPMTVAEAQPEPAEEPALRGEAESEAPQPKA